MTDKTTTALTAGSGLASTDLLYGVVGGNSRKITLAVLGTFLATAVLAAGTITTSQPMTLTQTWNAGGVTFNALLVNVTATASAAASTLLDLQVAGVSKFSVRKDGQLVPAFAGSASDMTIMQGVGGTATGISWITSGYIAFATAGTYFFGMDGGTDGLCLYNNKKLAFDSGAGSGDVVLARDAAGILAQRNSTNAQTLRVYNTYTDASNYERGKLAWSSNVFKVGTEVAGTGTVRDMQLVAGDVGPTISSVSLSGVWGAGSLDFGNVSGNAGIRWGTSVSFGFYYNAGSDAGRLRIVGNNGVVGSILPNGMGINTLGAGQDATNTAFVSIVAGTTAVAQINLASSTAPTSPNNGDVWFDGAALKIRISGATKTVTVT